MVQRNKQPVWYRGSTGVIQGYNWGDTGVQLGWYRGTTGVAPGYNWSGTGVQLGWYRVTTGVIQGYNWGGTGVQLGWYRGTTGVEQGYNNSNCIAHSLKFSQHKRSNYSLNKIQKDNHKPQHIPYYYKIIIKDYY